MKADSLTVTTSGGSYPIHFGVPALSVLAESLASIRESGASVAVITDTAVARAQGELLEGAGFKREEVLTLPPGEKTKSIDAYAKALSFLAGRTLNRDGVLFAFGGGVVGDLAGFAAASYLRGIRCEQIPTTLLAMVDSSVGGKTGLNLPEGKNLVGAFWQPSAVYIVPCVLETLPPREFAAGMAEVIKYGLLADDELFERIETLDTLGPRSEELAPIIRRCCAIKAGVVKADEKETANSGGRALLNLGHSFAHAIENAAGYGDYLHGEAVAIGLVLAARLSAGIGLVDASVEKRIAELNRRYRLPVELKAPLGCGALMTAMKRDKKNRAGNLRFVVLEAIGRAATRADIDPGAVEKIWLSAGAR